MNQQSVSNITEATVTIIGQGEYQQRHYNSIPRNEGESYDAYEERTWRETCHYRQEDDVVFIPGMALKKCIEEAAQFSGKKIPGRGNRTWARLFSSGIVVDEDVSLGITRDKLIGKRLFVPADGVAGHGKRVIKIYATIPPGWSGTARFVIVNPEITKEIFIEHLIIAGRFIGLGVFRPANKGMNGRFIINPDSVKWEIGKI